MLKLINDFRFWLQVRLSFAFSEIIEDLLNVWYDESLKLFFAKNLTIVFL